MPETSAGFFDRTVRSMRLAWRRAGGRAALRDTLAPDLDAGLERVRAQIDACLEGRGGEVSARARAAELGEAYLVLSSDGRRRFLQLLAADYGIDVDAVRAAGTAFAGAADDAARRAAQRRLRELLQPPRVRLLSQFNGLYEGIKFLVDLRAELIGFAATDTSLEPLDAELRELLASWFDIGFLQLTRITWNTPAALLEKLIAYEAVHAVRSWDDLKNRLSQDRRCYAFFHPSMPEEPLIFVQVALVNGLADNVQTLLDEAAPATDPDGADTAIFYSISNCQRGLAGVAFGNFLIKRVAHDLARDLPGLATFATLSPVPGLCDWLAQLDADELNRRIDDAPAERLRRVAEVPDVADAVARLLARPDWHADAALARVLEPVLMQLCAHYLTTARRGRQAHDRVAHFHLSNGARIERLNWLADTSMRGLEQSAGIMVNYRYKLNDVEKNHEAYTGEGKVNASAAVRRLV
ncbi:MAG: malonyl-CoA decarboxylase family protein [Gammaproteobacteria bacterium]|nr:malonyl-CoA decarboxylase family protein [Gammaproteobacteria bacterium]